MADEPKPGGDQKPDANSRYAALVNALWNDSSPAGAALRAKAKEMFPDVQTPEDQVGPAIAPLKAQNDALAAEIKALREEREAEKKAREEATATQTLEQAISAARAKFNLTDEGFDKMVERMKATGNYADAEAAAAWVAQQTPPPKPPGPAWLPSHMNLFGSRERDDALAELHRDPLGFEESVLREWARDPDKFVAETFGTA